MNLETVKSRLELIHESIRRGRAAFIASIIASLASLIRRVERLSLVVSKLPAESDLVRR